MKSICGNIYLKAPQGPSMSFPQYHWMTVQSLENLKETDRETLNKHRVCSCVCLCVRGDGNAAAVRPSIIAVKSMPNEDAEMESLTAATKPVRLIFFFFFLNFRLLHLFYLHKNSYDTYTIHTLQYILLGKFGIVHQSIKAKLHLPVSTRNLS